jgi:hypothetical protein
VPENDLLAWAEFPLPNEIHQRPKSPTRINGIKQNALEPGHKRYRVAFQGPHHSVTCPQIARLQKDVLGMVAPLEAKEFRSLICEVPDERLERLFARLSLVDPDSDDFRWTANRGGSHEKAGVSSA